MAWRDDLLPASFRGVPFEVEDDALAGGRRVVLAEFPGREDNATEDLGRRARRFRLTAFLVAEDVAARRDALLTALEKPGAGPLVHPRYGRIDVLCDSYEARHSAREGRFAAVSIEFVEAAAFAFPRVTADTTSIVRSRAATAKTATRARFVATFDAVSDWGAVATGAVDDASAKLDTINDALRAPGAAFARTSAELSAAVLSLADNIETLINTPGALADQFQNVLSLITDTAGALASSVSALWTHRHTAAGVLPVIAVSAGTSALQQQADNTAALDRLLLRSALAEACIAASDTAFDSADEAEAARDEIADRLAETAGDEDDRDAYDALLDLRTALGAFINEVAAELPRERTFTPRTTTSAFELAQRLYGDGSRADEISSKNDIAHPGFVPGGAALRVVSS